MITYVCMCNRLLLGGMPRQNLYDKIFLHTSARIHTHIYVSSAMLISMLMRVSYLYVYVYVYMDT